MHRCSSSRREYIAWSQGCSKAIANPLPQTWVYAASQVYLKSMWPIVCTGSGEIQIGLQWGAGNIHSKVPAKLKLNLSSVRYLCMKCALDSLQSFARLSFNETFAVKAFFCLRSFQPRQLETDVHNQEQIMLRNEERAQKLERKKAEEEAKKKADKETKKKADEAKKLEEDEKKEKEKEIEKEKKCKERRAEKAKKKEKKKAESKIEKEKKRKEQKKEKEKMPE